MTTYKGILAFDVKDTEISDLLETAGYAIAYWAESLDYGDRKITVVDTGEAAEAGAVEHTICFADIVRGAAEIMDGKHVRRDISEQVRSAVLDDGDLGMVDGEAAECILQVALFGEVVYG